MKCKYCGSTIPDASVFCMICGERVARKKRVENPPARYPKPRTLSDGTLLGQLMVDGSRQTVKAATEKEYHAKIDALRAGVMELKAHPDRRPLRTVLRSYIDKNDAVLSPATIRGYETIYDNRFRSYMDTPVGSIDYQAMINEEAKSVSPKTVKNAWGLVSAAFRDAKLPVPDVNLPAIPESDEDFLDHEQIQTFLKAIHGDCCEAAALLMLHSLRLSEALAVNASDIKNNQIQVRGAIVHDKNHKLVEKKTNKNRTSARTVPVMIPRLLELIPADGKVVTYHPTTIRTHVEDACTRAGLPVCSPHDLRRSFASLGYHLRWSERAIMAIGGWNNLETVHRIYVKLSQKDLSADIKSMQNYYGFTTAPEKPSK
ncbi:MAG: tyrosine-type recombinase/integrase [Oscillospiraceae bacterium]|nr:tyrosine-type recombinase/integrase [Oscillospiraceae bacterium]